MHYCRDSWSATSVYDCGVCNKPFTQNGTEKHARFEGGKVMTTIVFNFFKANVKDDSVLPFIKKMEEILKTFAGEAYHFRYYLEEPQNTTERKTPGTV